MAQDKWVFSKYASRGAYHWAMISRNPKKHHPAVKARYLIVLQMLAEIRGLAVLDLGCGDGALTGLLARSGARVVGVDPNQQGIALARMEFSRHRLPGQFYLHTSDLPEASFDAVVCSEVIEHVADPPGLLMEICRLLKPGGIAIVSTPIRRGEHVTDPEHRKEYYPTQFEALCAQCFDVLEVRHDLPVSLHDLLHLSGPVGRLVGLLLRVASAWFNWNYMLRVQGAFTVNEVQFLKLRRRGASR